MIWASVIAVPDSERREEAGGDDVSRVSRPELRRPVAVEGGRLLFGGMPSEALAPVHTHRKRTDTPMGNLSPFMVLKTGLEIDRPYFIMFYHA